MNLESLVNELYEGRTIPDETSRREFLKQASVILGSGLIAHGTEPYYGSGASAGEQKPSIEVWYLTGPVNTFGFGAGWFGVDELWQIEQEISLKGKRL